MPHTGPRPFPFGPPLWSGVWMQLSPTVQVRKQIQGSLTSGKLWSQEPNPSLCDSEPWWCPFLCFPWCSESLRNWSLVRTGRELPLKGLESFFRLGLGMSSWGLFAANALWFQVVPVSEFRKRKWLLGAAFQAPPKHSSCIPPTEPPEAGTGNEWWYYCQLRLRDAIKSDALKRFWAMTRVQNQSGKPHWPPAIFASGMIWPNDFNLIWLHSPLPSSIQLSPNDRKFCSLITNVWFIDNLRVVKTGVVDPQSIGYPTMFTLTVRLHRRSDWTELNYVYFTGIHVISGNSNDHLGGLLILTTTLFNITESVWYKII